MLHIYRSEASASLRRVPIWLVTSNGTSPATAENAGQPQVYWQARNSLANTGATLSVVSANAGEYYCELSASEVSQLGVAQLQYRSATALQNATYFQIVNYDSGNSQDYGLAGFSTVTLAVGTHSGATIQGLSRINSSVTIADGTYSAVSVRHQAGDYGSITTFGVSKILAGSYSGVSFGVLDIKPASYSGVTVGIDNIKGASYSDVTVQGLSNYANISNVTLAAGTHSGATIQGLSRINSSVTIANAVYSAVSVRLDAVDYSSAVTVGVGKIAPASYSGVSIEVKTGGIQAVSFGANAVDAGALATDAGQEIADRILLRNIASGSDGGRDFRQALYAIRNRVLMSGSTGTVYQVDDATSAWTFSIATVAAVAINELKPGGV